MNQAVTEYIDQKKKGSCMLGINYLAVVVAAVATFVASSVWYTVFGTERIKLLGINPDAMADPCG